MEENPDPEVEREEMVDPIAARPPELEVQPANKEFQLLDFDDDDWDHWNTFRIHPIGQFSICYLVYDKIQFRIHHLGKILEDRPDVVFLIHCLGFDVELAARNFERLAQRFKKYYEMRDTGSNVILLKKSQAQRDREAREARESSEERKAREEREERERQAEELAERRETNFAPPPGYEYNDCHENERKCKKGVETVSAVIDFYRADAKKSVRLMSVFHDQEENKGAEAGSTTQDGDCIRKIQRTISAAFFEPDPNLPNIALFDLHLENPDTWTQSVPDPYRNIYPDHFAYKMIFRGRNHPVPSEENGYVYTSDQEIIRFSQEPVCIHHRRGRPEMPLILIAHLFPFVEDGEETPEHWVDFNSDEKISTKLMGELAKIGNIKAHPKFNNPILCLA